MTTHPQSLSRPCGTCAACCTGVFSVAGLHDHGADCPHHVRTFDDGPAAGGCGDYENRPAACRTFSCLWKCFPRPWQGCGPRRGTLLPAGPIAADLLAKLPGSSCPLDDGDRPDRLGVLFILKRASQENLRPAGTADFRVVKAASLDGRPVTDHTRVREILFALAAAGLPAVIAAADGDERRRAILAPRGPLTAALARDIHLALCVAGQTGH